MLGNSAMGRLRDVQCGLVARLTGRLGTARLWTRGLGRGRSLGCHAPGAGVWWCPVASGWLRAFVVEGWLGGWRSAFLAVFSQVMEMPKVVCRRPVKPSAQPTLVRTQHLPPAKPQVRALRA